MSSPRLFFRSLRALIASIRPSRSRSRSAGTARPLGIGIALGTAAIVFLGGMAVLPRIEPEPGEQTPPPAPGPPPPAAAPPAPAAAMPADAPTHAIALVADGGSALAVRSPAAEEAVPPPPPAAPPTPARRRERVAKESEEAAPAPRAEQPAENKPAPPRPAVEERRATDRSKLTDKDIAREAWRKNVPDLNSEDGKVAILIPIKGSIEGASYHITTKPKGVLVNLPQAESLVTMRFYKFKREGFRQLWIKQEEGEGTSLRLVLGEASDPQVEIKEDFVRVTVRAAEPSAGAAPSSDEPGDGAKR